MSDLESETEKQLVQGGRAVENSEVIIGPNSDDDGKEPPARTKPKPKPKEKEQVKEKGKGKKKRNEVFSSPQ